MIGARTLARPAIAALFISGGITALRRPEPHAATAEPQLGTIASRLREAGVQADSQALVKVNGAVQVAAGGMLVFNIAPRIAAIALAGSLVPTTLAVHRFWEQQGDDRADQQVHLLKNLAIFGGLIFTALDTGGRPSVFWSSRRAAGRAAHAVSSKAYDLADALPTHS